MARTRIEKEIVKYNPTEIEAKWQKYWKENKIYQPNLDSAKKPFYNLMMFPYPSAEGMHVGNMYAFTGSDVFGRFMRMQGHDVFEPIGLDGFGIHSENYALKVGKHPKEQAKKSEENFYRQLREVGNAFAWDNKVETYDPEYYRWTQWIFIQLFKAGLAYRKKASVNFCPSCKTVLADEQVISGKCERCGTEVTKKDLEQWFFKITDYAEKLLNNIDKLDWTEKVKIAQRQWIGRSEGAEIEFRIQNSEFRIEVFTTRPDTLFGATFMVLAPEHPIVAQLLNSEFKIQNSKLEEIRKYIKKSQKKSEQERIAEGKEKTGMDTGLVVINPVNNEEIPVWIADYVLMGYGTGAIMAVPAHDKRDFEFAKKYNLPIKFVIKPNNEDINFEKPYIGPGEVINSCKDWDDYFVPDAIPKMIDDLEKKGIGKRKVNYHLRDWLISRQRYWGPPIPMINCAKCNWQPVAEKDLPVMLPDIKDWKPMGVGKSPLATIEDFVRTNCPNCGGEAKRETDVSDTFLDSAWYFFRYLSNNDKKAALSKKRVEKWLPVDMYIGGAEHSVLHLLYSRFLTMVFKDLKLINFEEPYSKFRVHGLLLKEGAKMSKSKGNVVIPDEYIKKYGADTLRLYLMFIGPFSQGGDFYDTGIEGMFRFLKRVWKIAHSDLTEIISDEAMKVMHRTIKRVTEDIQAQRYNTAIASIMEYYNFLSKEQTISKDQISTLILLISPLAPHISEELWEVVGEEKSIHNASWPKFDASFLTEKKTKIVVQIDGKVRDVLEVDFDDISSKQEIEKIARESQKANKYLVNRPIQDVIYVPGRIINFVLSDGNSTFT